MKMPRLKATITVVITNDLSRRKQMVLQFHICDRPCSGPRQHSRCHALEAQRSAQPAATITIATVVVQLWLQMYQRWKLLVPVCRVRWSGAWRRLLCALSPPTASSSTSPTRRPLQFFTPDGVDVAANVTKCRDGSFALSYGVPATANADAAGTLDVFINGQRSKLSPYSIQLSARRAT
jgi:hypothetical protein